MGRTGGQNYRIQSQRRIATNISGESDREREMVR